MGANGNRLTTAVIWFLLALCGALVAWMFLAIDPEFARLSRAGSLLDARFSGYEPATVRGLHDLLAKTDMAEARDVLRFYYTVPDMILPLAASLLGVLLMLRFAPGNMIFGRPVSPGMVRAFCLLPIGYGVVDYLENFVALAYFPPAQPGPWLTDAAPEILPWLSAIKQALLTVTFILVVRFSVLRYTAHTDRHGSD